VICKTEVLTSNGTNNWKNLNRPWAPSRSLAGADIVTVNGFVNTYIVDPNWTPPLPPIPISNGKQKNIWLYDVAQSRSGDKGDTSNVSLIPYNEADFITLKQVITKEWALKVFQHLITKGQTPVINIYELNGIKALNIVVEPVLDGGVSVSRRIDRHGKTFSDLLLNQQIAWPAYRNGNQKARL